MATQATSARALSVGEAARKLDVGVSTLKRWADSGRIESFRTAGGHRRFAPEAVERLRARQQEGEEVGWLDVLQGESDPHFIAAELLHGRARLGSWWAVADELGPVLQEMGRRWERGELSVLQEHLASERLARGLAWCAQSLPLPAAAPVALLAMVEGDDHTLGLSLAELTLREQGWGALWAGRRTPLGDLVEMVHRGEVQLVALSASRAAQDADVLRRTAAILGAAAQVAGVALVLGGEGGWPEPPPHGSRLRTFAELQSLLRSLGRGRP